MIKDWKDVATILAIIVLTLVFITGVVVSVTQYFSAETTLAAIGWLILGIVSVMALAVIAAITS